jgi:hypothetical protein
MKFRSQFNLALTPFLAILILVLSASAQNDPRPALPSYEATLQVVVGTSGGAAGANVPANLRGVIAELRPAFAFADYRLDSTYVMRVGNTGSFEYKSVSTTIGSGPDSETPSFLEWTVSGVRAADNDKGQKVFQTDAFRFGARVPVRTGGFTDPATSRVTPSVNYESVGVTASRVSVPENTPTLIGTLSLPKTAGTMFLVLTLKTTP